MKKLSIGLLIGAVIIMGVALYTVSRSNILIREAVLEYGPKATRAKVTLDKVDVALMGGQLGLSRLTLGNPQGFKSDYAFKVGQVAVQIDLDSLFSDVIRIKEIRIEGADLIYEIGTKGNNISKIQQNIKAYTQSLGLGEGAAEAEGREPGEGAKFIVDHIYINGTKVKLATDLLGGKGTAVNLPDIHLKNIGTEDKQATAGEVGGAIFGAINKGLKKVITKDLLEDTLKDVKKKLGDIFKKR